MARSHTKELGDRHGYPACDGKISKEDAGVFPGPGLKHCLREMHANLGNCAKTRLKEIKQHLLAPTSSVGVYRKKKGEE